jgi:hypothetical protein
LGGTSIKFHRQCHLAVVVQGKGDVMGKYYYTPFDKTDENERLAWNICRGWGAKFADTKLTPGIYLSEDVSLEGGKRRFYTPENLAKSLVEDGLKNIACNIRLLCCFGGGVQAADSEAIKKSCGLRMPLTPLAKTLALRMGEKLGVNQFAVQPEPGIMVSGYVGATNSKLNKTVFFVDVNGNKQYENAENHTRWYNLHGGLSIFGGNEEADDVAKAGLRGLDDIKAGDVLYIMAHGDWKSGGRFLPDAGDFLVQTSEVVDRNGRMRGEAAVEKNTFADTKTKRAGKKFGDKAERWTGPELPTKGAMSDRIAVTVSKDGKLKIIAFDETGNICRLWDEARTIVTEKSKVEFLKVWFSAEVTSAFAESKAAQTAKTHALSLAQSGSVEGMDY